MLKKIIIITASELVGHGQEFGHELVSESEADGIIEKYHTKLGTFR